MCICCVVCHAQRAVLCTHARVITFLLVFPWMVTFVNDMPNVINSVTLGMFADASKCYRIINNNADFSNLQQDLFSLTTWSLSNELHFQPTKCSNLCISRKRISPYRSYSINGIDVEVVSTEKDLGVVVVNDTLEGSYTHDSC